MICLHCGKEFDSQRQNPLCQECADAGWGVCAECGEVYHTGDEGYQGFCGGCITVCENCGSISTPRNLVEVIDGYCNQCADEECACCGNYRPLVDGLCRNCEADGWDICNECGDVYNAHDGGYEGYCDNCIRVCPSCGRVATPTNLLRIGYGCCEYCGTACIVCNRLRRSTEEDYPICSDCQERGCRYCSNCGIAYDGHYCHNCTPTCSVCGRRSNHIVDERCPICRGVCTVCNTETPVNSQGICLDCVAEEYALCPVCGVVFCGECFCGYIPPRCEDCGQLVAVKNYFDGRVVCDSCSELSIPAQQIHSYDYRPPFFNLRGDGVLYLGVEIEADKGGEDKIKGTKHFLSYFMEAPNKCFVYMKHDGSLRNGIEFVTHPATLEYHRSLEDKYRRAFKDLIRNEYRGHDTETCGLHVHVDRRALGETNLEQEVTLLKITLFLEQYWERVFKLSRRDNESLANYARNYGIKPEDKNPYTFFNDLKMFLLDSKYKNLNILNSRTIEFRFFKGTLKFETYMATLEFIHFLITYLKEEDDLEVILTEGWDNFICYLECSDQMYLLDYLARRCLYDKAAPICVGAEEDSINDAYLYHYGEEAIIG